MIFKRLLYVFLLIVVFRAVTRSSFGQMNNPLPVLEFIVPKPGQTYEGAIRFKATFKNMTNRTCKVRMADVDMIHHHILGADEKKPASQRVTMWLEDKYFPCSPGAHSLELIVTLKDDPDTVLLKQRIHFTIKKPPSLDRALAEAERSSYICYGSAFEGAERRYAELANHFSSTDPAARRVLEWQADKLFEERIRYALSGISGLSSIAWRYAEALDPDRALGILETARRVFEEDFSLLAVHPVKGTIPYYDANPFYNPSCFKEIADLYARYGHLDKALAWCDKEEVFFRKVAEKAKSMDDRRGAFYTLSRLYDRSALYHLLLADDEQAWENHRSQSRVFRQKAEALISSE